MSGVKISINDADITQVISRLNKFGNKAKDEVSAITKKTALQISNDAKKLAPVRTSFLRKNIRASRAKSMVKVVSGAKYSSYVEYGTSKQGAQPFMRPAFEKGRATYKKALYSALNKLTRFPK